VPAPSTQPHASIDSIDPGRVPKIHRVSTRWPIFDHELAFDPTAVSTPDAFDAFVKRAPAKWVVYLLADENDNPVQLLCVKNLRYSLKRRLGTRIEIEDIGPTRRVDYRDIVRKIYWRRVDSAFEADFIYLEAARVVFPQTYRGMLGFRPAWFVHVNPHTTFPRYIKTINLTGPTGTYFGPLEDKHSAQRLVHLIENVFDLCRDYSIFTQSPEGPCPWKQMNKCVGPCDGTVSLDEYAQIIDFSAQVLSDPARHIELETERMKTAAEELRFETAARIKQRVDQLSQLGKGPFRHVRPLQHFRFLSLQRGPTASAAKLFLITPGRIEEVAGLIDTPKDTSDLLRSILKLAESRGNLQVDEIGAERVAVVSHQLFVARNRHGVFLPLAELEERSFAKAYRELLNQKVQGTPEESEGVTKELQAM
jgi:excinuclease UvrABC nuclease subunit